MAKEKFDRSEEHENLGNIGKVGEPLRVSKRKDLQVKERHIAPIEHDIRFGIERVREVRLNKRHNEVVLETIRVETGTVITYVLPFYMKERVLELI